MYEATLDGAFSTDSARAALPQVKHVVIEMYAATLDKFKSNMLEAVHAALLPIIYVNVDLWKSKFSGEKFLGEQRLQGYCE